MGEDGWKNSKLSLVNHNHASHIINIETFLCCQLKLSSHSCNGTLIHVSICMQLVINPPPALPSLKTSHPTLTKLPPPPKCFTLHLPHERSTFLTLLCACANVSISRARLITHCALHFLPPPSLPSDRNVSHALFTFAPEKERFEPASPSDVTYVL